MLAHKLLILMENNKFSHQSSHKIDLLSNYNFHKTSCRKGYDCKIKLPVSSMYNILQTFTLVIMENVYLLMWNLNKYIYPDFSSISLTSTRQFSQTDNYLIESK